MREWCLVTTYNERSERPYSYMERCLLLLQIGVVVFFFFFFFLGMGMRRSIGWWWCLLLLLPAQVMDAEDLEPLAFINVFVMEDSATLYGVAISFLHLHLSELVPINPWKPASPCASSDPNHSTSSCVFKKSHHTPEHAVYTLMIACIVHTRITFVDHKQIICVGVVG